jgi:long-subunit acyl-CoA synthetase (AMP-forming)
MLWSQVQKVAQQSENKLALVGDSRAYTYKQLIDVVNHVADELQSVRHRVVALYADNCPEWVIVDLACQLAGITLLPLPSFFSDHQLNHAVAQAGASAVIHVNDDRMSQLLVQTNTFGVCERFVLSKTSIKETRIPDKASKITFTSGSTGEPKGVCLSKAQQFSVADQLNKVLKLASNKHLSLLPFSTLLENVAGVYLTFLAGGTVLALPKETLGFNGSSGFNINDLLASISHHQPSSLILLPELLTALVTSVENGWKPPKTLEFIAVGGSKVFPELLKQAQQVGLPVYEGYGLSECASVVSLNVENNTKVGSVGRPLGHLSVVIENNEVMVSGNTFLGYVNEPESWNLSTVTTGDLGHLDDEGYLFINGRKKNLIISSFGRNINPEWVESSVLSNVLIKQCVVFGDAKPFCTAVIYLADKTSSDDDIQAWINAVNQTLPDYAQVTRWIRLEEPLSVKLGLLTANGRPKREAVLQTFYDALEALYSDELLAS